MKQLAVIACCLLACPLPALAAWPWAAEENARASGPVHPAVVRIIAPGAGSVSYGSGTLIAINEQHGLVITNWHVVNEATGQITVVFPDGFQSGGTLQKVDRDWDLAALAIWRPKVEPVRMANSPPQPGEMLTIAGYGSGSYRSASGRCTQYVAPGLKFPYEMVELAASARQGDSGGPIFNSRGELAGVLFGEGQGRTSGSYCGRVQWFLASIVPGTSSPDAALIASRVGPPVISPASPTGSTAVGSATGRPALGSLPRAIEVGDDTRLATIEQGDLQGWHAAAPAQRVAPQSQFASSESSSARLRRTPTSTAVPPAADLAQPAAALRWSDFAGDTPGEQMKTILATIGALGIFLYTVSWLGSSSSAGSAAAKAKE